MNETPARSDLGQVTGRGLVLPDDAGGPPRALAVAYTRYLAAACRRFLAIEAELPAARRPVHGRIAGLVRQALQRDQAQMLACFTAPAVGTPLQCLALRPEMDAYRVRIDGAVGAMMPHLLLEMALRRLLPDGQAVLWEHAAPRLASVAIGGELIPPAYATGLRFSTDYLAAMEGDAEVARVPVDPEAMHQVLAEESGGFRFARRFWSTGTISWLATIDHNPIAAFEAHPDKAGNHVDLGGHPEEKWVGILDEAFALVERFMPGEFAEMEVLLQEIVPVGCDDERHLSASYREAVGTIYLTLHPNLMTMTEAIIHEFQHNKFNVSAYSADYLVNAFHPLYKSPVRPDPRPLWGIVLAVHAFLPVAELYRRMRDARHPWAARPDFERRMSEVDLKNHEGMEMLRANAQFTPAGRAMFDELEQLERRHLGDRAARGLDNQPTASHLA